MSGGQCWYRSGSSMGFKAWGDTETHLWGAQPGACIPEEPGAWSRVELWLGCSQGRAVVQVQVCPELHTTACPRQHMPLALHWPNMTPCHCRPLESQCSMSLAQSTHQSSVPLGSDRAKGMQLHGVVFGKHRARAMRPQGAGKVQRHGALAKHSSTPLHTPGSVPLPSSRTLAGQQCQGHAAAQSWGCALVVHQTTSQPDAIRAPYIWHPWFNLWELEQIQPCQDLSSPPKTVS